MKVNIDQHGCIECGACEQTCSEVFIVKIGEKASIQTKYQMNTSDAGVIPNELSHCVEDAVASCPVQVINIG